MLQFNRKGLLIPTTNIKSNIEEFEREFVTEFNDPHRKELFEKYLVYVNALKKALGNIMLLQWVDGSFVTKKSKPSDIDMVTFIDAKSIENAGKLIEDFKFPLSIENYGIDAYMVKTYKQEDDKYSLYVSDMMYWKDNFGKTRRNRNGEKHAKGFLEIIY